MGTETSEWEGYPAFAKDRLKRLKYVLAGRDSVLQSCEIPGTNVMKMILVSDLTVNDTVTKFWLDPNNYLRGVDIIIIDIMLDLRREGYSEAAKRILEKYEKK